MDAQPLKVRGVTVSAHTKTRTIRLDVFIHGGDDLSLEMPLPTATRLTDLLVDAEFLERCGNDLSPASHGLLEKPALARADAVAPARKPPSLVARFASATRHALSFFQKRVPSRRIA